MIALWDGMDQCFCVHTLTEREGQDEGHFAHWLGLVAAGSLRRESLGACMNYRLGARVRCDDGEWEKELLNCIYFRYGMGKVYIWSGLVGSVRTHCVLRTYIVVAMRDVGLGGLG